jgi:signal transduction histidine kinase
LRRLIRPTLGLLGQLIAILLLTTVVEFGVSTLLYERASQFSVRDDEARRLAEHLVIAERLLSERPPEQRAAAAQVLTTDRYLVRWLPRPPRIPTIAPSLDGMEAQVTAWEPSLAGHSLHLWLPSPGHRSLVRGALTLPDGSGMTFQMLDPVDGLNLASERVLIAMIPAVGLLLLGGLLVRLALRPLRRLVVAVDTFGDGNATPVLEQGPREILSVIRAFNRMQHRIRQLIENRTQALAAVGHDFRTPLARLRLRAEELPDEEARDAITRDVAEMEAMIGSLLAYLSGEDDPEQPTPTDLASLCETAVDDAADRGLDARYSGPDHVEASVRPISFRRAVVNLLDNALQHGTTATVHLQRRAGEICLAVEDNGPGIPEDMLEEVLKPFVRIDAARPRDVRGFGLGLSIVVRAVEQEGGSFRLRNRPSGGLRAEIILPVS